MKLVKMNDAKVGLVVSRADGLYIVDVARSVGVFAPHDPLSNGLLNGVFKDGCDWSTVIRHWKHLERPLMKLAGIARISPNHPRLAMQPFSERFLTLGSPDQVRSIEVTVAADHDPTGRSAMQRQLAWTSEDEILYGIPPEPHAAQIVVFPTP